MCRCLIGLGFKHMANVHLWAQWRRLPVNVWRHRTIGVSSQKSARILFKRCHLQKMACGHYWNTIKLWTIQWTGWMVSLWRKTWSQDVLLSWKDTAGNKCWDLISANYGHFGRCLLYNFCSKYFKKQLNQCKIKLFNLFTLYVCKDNYITLINHILFTKCKNLRWPRRLLHV